VFDKLFFVFEDENCFLFFRLFFVFEDENCFLFLKMRTVFCFLDKLFFVFVFL